MSDAILKLSSVSKVTTLGRTNIYKKIKEGTFPKPISLGPRAVGWLQSEIDEWIKGRVAARVPGATLGATSRP